MGSDVVLINILEVVIVSDPHLLMFSVSTDEIPLVRTGEQPEQVGTLE
jgi:hypothetical protein